ncbi:MAG: menaquinone biosynthesis protein [Bacteroidetes bacterium]|nr:menaquinone biosynthesis protein [Bacteroidota bacterium]
MVRISAVSYLNTFPFVFGLRESGFLKDFILELDVPSICARKLIENVVDIALTPTGALPETGNVYYLTDYCIGATGPVKTVLLLSKAPVNEISTIHLDFDSRTSVELTRILAKNHWKINPAWVSLKPGEADKSRRIESLVAIGDKTFTLSRRYPFVYDLAEEWIKFSGVPFVFAVWASKKRLPEELINSFNQALAFGIQNKSQTIEYFKDRLPPFNDCLGYLERNISYSFDAAKKQGLKLFLDYIGQT